MAIFEDLKKKYTELLNPIKQSLNDNQGFFQQGKFTAQPVQQAIQNWQAKPSNVIGSKLVKATGPVGQALVGLTQGAGGQFLPKPIKQAVYQNIPEPKNNIEKLSNLAGNIYGFSTGIPGKALSTLGTVGTAGASKLLPNLSPIASKVAGGIGAETLQTAGLLGAQKLSGENVGIKDIPAQLGLGLLTRGITSPTVISKVAKMFGGDAYVSDFQKVNNALQRLKTMSGKQKFTTEEMGQLVKDAKLYNKSYNLMPEKEFNKLNIQRQYDLIANKLENMVRSGQPPIMGITDNKIINPTASGEVGVPKIDPLESLKQEARKYKSAEEFVNKSTYDTTIKNKNIKFENSVTDSFDGQVSGNIIAKDKGGKVMGILEYSSVGEVPYIDMVGVKPELRNSGIGKDMVKTLQSEYPTSKIEWGMMTPEGNNLKNSLDKQLTDIYNQAKGVGGEGVKLKTRGFTESVQEAPSVVKQVKQIVGGSYSPKSNQKLMGEAKALLESGAKIDFKNTQNLDAKVAATIKEAINQQQLGNHEAAANLFNNLSEHATELGRSVQAFSLLKNMSPEAIALSAAGKIKKYNLANPGRKIPELTGDQLKMISDKVAAIDLLKGREKNIALNELNNTINEFIPSSFGDKAIAVWKAGLLTSLRTHERNFIGNTVHGLVETLKDIPATAADIVLSAKTGQRTTTFTTKGLGEFGSKSTLQQMQDIISKGYDPSEQINKFDHKQITWGKSPVEQVLKKYTDIVFRTLGAADKPFYNSALSRSLYDQAGAAAINAGKRGDAAFIENLVKNPTEEMMKIAISDANVATFKDKNKVSAVASAIKRTLGENELTKLAGEVLLPFTGVPSSIAGQITNYSPIGLLKGIYTSGRVLSGQVPELQRQAAKEIGRGVIGTGIFGLGAYLMSKGLITGQPKDQAEQRQWELENKPRNSILIGGKWRSLNSIGPEAIVLLSGSKLQEERQTPDGSLSNYGLSIGKDLLDQSFVQGLQGPVNALTDPYRYGKSYAGGLVSSFVPNIVKDLAKSTDPYSREANTIMDYAKSNIPKLRTRLPERRDVLGNIIPQEPTGLGAFFDLFNSKTPIDNAVVKELSRLNSAGENATPSKLTPSQTIAKQKIKLTFEQLNNLEAGIGEALRPQLQKLISSPQYQQLDDESKSKAIDKVVQSTRTQYKTENAQQFGITPTAPIPTVKKVSVKKSKKVTLSKIKTVKIKTPKLKKIKVTKPKKPKVTVYKRPPIKKLKKIA